MHCCLVHCSLVPVRLAWTVPLKRWPNPGLSCWPMFHRPAVAGILSGVFVKCCSVRREGLQAPFNIVSGHQ